MMVLTERYELMSSTQQTHDHQTIKDWTLERDGVPAKVKGTGNDSDQGVLRLHFPKKKPQ